jgi:Virulence factor membrane-bound polymerase, C-terminal
LAFAHFDTLYKGDRFCAILDNAHNLPLHLAVTLGVPAALVISLGFALWVWKKLPWAEAMPARHMAWGLLAVLLLHSMLEYPLWYGPFQAVALVSLYLLWGKPKVGQADIVEVDSLARQKNRDKKWQYSQFIYGFSAAILVATFAYIAWDYHRISQIYLAPALRTAPYQLNPMGYAKDSVLFRSHVQFAALTTTVLTTANAADVNAMGKAVLHFSPEAAVVQKIIESAVMLKRDNEALYYLERFRAAYPVEHKAWAEQLSAKLPPSVKQPQNSPTSPRAFHAK